LIHGAALILTISNGEITRLRMLEGSFAVSRAARAEEMENDGRAC
jgi:hypothetical protein